jgi:hypothetical protein
MMMLNMQQRKIDETRYEENKDMPRSPVDEESSEEMSQDAEHEEHKEEHS